MVKSVSRTPQEISARVAQVLIDRRELHGYAVGDVGRYLGFCWSLSSRAATARLKSLESGHAADGLANARPDAYRHFVTSLSGYCSALGLPRDARRSIRRDVRELQPGFEFDPSTVLPYDPSHVEFSSVRKLLPHLYSATPEEIDRFTRHFLAN